MSAPQDVQIRDESIKLGQLLKLAGLVTVDGQIDTRRSAQIRGGSIVCLEDECLKVTSARNLTSGEELSSPHARTVGEHDKGLSPRAYEWGEPFVMP